MSEQRRYKPDGAQLLRYLRSTAPFVCIQGPVSSGKSVCSAMRLMMAAMTTPLTQGKRRSRWLVTRNSYPDLEQSTIKTWLDWFPEKLYGRFAWSPPYTHYVEFGDVEAEFVFESFKGAEDIPSLKSREYTGAWANEGQFYDQEFMVALYERTGRFPHPQMPRFVQMDMNAPPLGHWVPMMRGDAPIPEEFTDSQRRSLIKPPEWEFLLQPPWFVEELDPQGGVQKYRINPEAENLSVVGERAVMSLLDGRTKDKIDADLMNRVLIVQSGRPVFPMFQRETHVAKAPLSVVPDVTIHVGLDFGRQPAAVAAQQVGGRWFFLNELIGSNMSATEFAPHLRRFLAAKFPDVQPGAFVFWGDPSGDEKRSEVDDRTAFGIFEQNGMLVRKVDRGNRRTVRVETATHVMNSMVGGQPKLVVSPACPTLITGWAGGYVFRRKTVSGAPTFDTEPAKNQFSHVSDAALEVLMGGGESRVMLGRAEKAKPVNTLAAALSRGREVFGARAAAR